MGRERYVNREGCKDIREGIKDIKEGLKDIREGLKDIEEGLEDLDCERDYDREHDKDCCRKFFD